MTAAASILSWLEAAGLRLRAEAGNLVVSPKDAVTDELRALMRSHKPELLAELQGRPVANEPAPLKLVKIDRVDVFHLPAGVAETASPLEGLDCSGCNHLEMREEPQPGTRRRFFWRCKRGHELLEGRNYGARIILAPPECDEASDFRPWKSGTR
jgi:hypothetical protein